MYRTLFVGHLFRMGCEIDSYVTDPVIISKRLRSMPHAQGRGALLTMHLSLP